MCNFRESVVLCRSGKVKCMRSFNDGLTVSVGNTDSDIIARMCRQH